MAFVVPLFAATTGGAAAFSLGLTDRPAFTVEPRLCRSQGSLDVFALVACTTERSIGKNAQRLLDGTKKGLEKIENGPKWMSNAAKLYGTPEGSTELGIGLYFDDPRTTDNPRWAVGWAVAPASLFEIQRKVDELQQESGLSEPLRAVRISHAKVIRGTIPYRNAFTPSIAALLHWGRAFREMGFESKSGRESEEGSIAMEVYVKDKDNRMVGIDYVILYGNTRHAWDDTFPVPKEENNERKDGPSKDE